VDEPQSTIMDQQLKSFLGNLFTLGHHTRMPADKVQEAYTQFNASNSTNPIVMALRANCPKPFAALLSMVDTRLKKIVIMTTFLGNASAKEAKFKDYFTVLQTSVLHLRGMCDAAVTDIEEGEEGALPFSSMEKVFDFITDFFVKGLTHEAARETFAAPLKD